MTTAKTIDERKQSPTYWSLQIAIVLLLVAPLTRLFLWPLLASPFGPIVVALLWLAPAILAAALVSSVWGLVTGLRRHRRLVVLPLLLDAVAVVLWCAAGYPQEMGWLTRYTSDTSTLKSAWRTNRIAYNLLVRVILSDGGKTESFVRVPLLLRFPLAGHEDLTMQTSHVEVFGNPEKPSVYFGIKAPAGLIGGWDAFGYLYTPENPNTLRYGEGRFDVVEPLAKDWYIARW